MPATPAITLHSHVDLDADPVRLSDEAFILVQRCRASVECGIRDRYVDTSGVCFLRVDADPRLTFNLDYFVRENDGLADYHPGRDLSDRAVAFVAGDSMRHQFSDDGIFIYESASDEDPAGELRAGSCVISYDLHSGADLTTYPTTSGPAAATYTDVPANAAETEISDTAKNLLLQDIFNGESNLDDDFTVSAYDGDPAGAGTLLHSITEVEPWVAIGTLAYAYHYYAQPPNDLIFNSTGSTRSVSHIRLARGSNVLCDVELDSPVSIPANTTLRIPKENISISLKYYWGSSAGTDAGNTGDVTENPSAYFLGYCLGGTRFTLIPEACFDLQIYETDPSGVPGVAYLDTFRVPASSAYWTVSSLTVVPAWSAMVAIGSLLGGNAAPSTWNYDNVILRLCGLPVWVINQTGSFSISTGNYYSSNTEPSLDIDA